MDQTLRINISSQVAILLTLLPNLIYILLDRRTWRWDQADYGRHAIEHYSRLLESPVAWFDSLSMTLSWGFGAKAPMMIWLGQFFVPLEYFLGSVDGALLLLNVVAQGIMLWLIFETVLRLTRHNYLLAWIGVLTMASSALFIGLGHNYMTETLQTLGVTWMVFTLAHAPHWSRLEIMVNFLGAGLLAIMTKISSPLYMLFPAIVILYFLVVQPEVGLRWGKVRSSAIPILFLAIFTPVSIIWLRKNLLVSLDYAQLSAASIAHGANQPLMHKVIFWLMAFRTNFLLGFVMLLLGSVLLYRIVQILTGRKQALLRTYFSTCFIVSVLQLILVIVVVSLQTNEDPKYIFPLLPYVSLAIAWIAYSFKFQKLTWLLVSALCLQFLLAYSYSFGFIPYAHFTFWLEPIAKDSQDVRMLEQVATETCSQYYNRQEPHPITTVVGVSLPRMNAFLMQYEAEKKTRSSFLNAHCLYLGIEYLGVASEGVYVSDAASTMLAISFINPHYFIAVNDSTAFQGFESFNRTAMESFKMIATNPAYQLEKQIPGADVEVFKRREF